MTKFLSIVVIAVLLFCGLALPLKPETAIPPAPAVLAAPAAGVPRLAWRWSFVCDPLKVGHNYATATLRLTGGEFMVVAEFGSDSFGSRKTELLPDFNQRSAKAFKILPSEDSSDWLVIRQDGSLDPDSTGFVESMAALAYPGGYDQLASEISTYDWVEIHEGLKKDYLEVEKTNPTCEIQPKRLTPGFKKVFG